MQPAGGDVGFVCGRGNSDGQVIHIGDDQALRHLGVKSHHRYMTKKKGEMWEL